MNNSTLERPITSKPWAGVLLFLAAAATQVFVSNPVSGQELSKGSDHVLIAKAPRKKGGTRAVAPVDQIFEYPGCQKSFSSILNVEGTPGYCITTSGPTRGIYCRRVHPGGCASQLGIQDGDVLISLNGHACTDLPEADKYLQSASPSQLRGVFAHPEVNRLALYTATCPFAGWKSGSTVDTNTRSQWYNTAGTKPKENIQRVKTY